MFDKEKLKQAMDDHGDTNKALAVFLGMTASNFSTIWNGRQPFQRKHIVRIAVRYQLSPQDVWDIFFLADAEAIKSEPPAEPVVCSRPIRARFRRLSLKTR